MYDVLCVTARNLCREDFLTRLEKIADAKPTGIILREKDLSENEYATLAKKALDICGSRNTACILHGFPNVARSLNCRALHMPLLSLGTLTAEERAWFTTLGASCHSLGDAIEARQLGCTYITAGHVFDTDCKKNLPGRGLDFLKNICSNTDIPVYAIGGISPYNISDVIQSGASGCCVMSGAMTCDNVEEYIAQILHGGNDDI